MGWTEGREGVRRKVVGRDVGEVVVVRTQTASMRYRGVTWAKFSVQPGGFRSLSKSYVVCGSWQSSRLCVVDVRVGMSWIYPTCTSLQRRVLTAIYV